MPVWVSIWNGAFWWWQAIWWDPQNCQRMKVSIFFFSVTNSKRTNLHILILPAGCTLCTSINNKRKLKIEKWTFAANFKIEISYSTSSIALHWMNSVRQWKKDLKMKTSIYCIPSGNLQNIQENNNKSSNGFLYESNRDFFVLIFIVVVCRLGRLLRMKRVVFNQMSYPLFRCFFCFFFLLSIPHITLLIERSLVRACETNFKVP